MKKLLENFRKYLNEEEDMYSGGETDPQSIDTDNEENYIAVPDVIDTSEETLNNWIFGDDDADPEDDMSIWGILQRGDYGINDPAETDPDEMYANAELNDEERGAVSNVVGVLKSAESLSQDLQQKLSNLLATFALADRSRSGGVLAPELEEVRAQLDRLVDKTFGGLR